MVLSREPDARNGPWWVPVLLSDPTASLIAAPPLSGAQAMHSTVWSWSRNSICTERRKLSISKDLTTPSASTICSPCTPLCWCSKRGSSGRLSTRRTSFRRGERAPFAPIRDDQYTIWHNTWNRWVTQMRRDFSQSGCHRTLTQKKLPTSWWFCHAKRWERSHRLAQTPPRIRCGHVRASSWSTRRSEWSPTIWLTCRHCMRLSKSREFHCQSNGDSLGRRLRWHLPRILPCASNAMSWTESVCPLSVRSYSPVSKSHTLIVASSEDEINRLNTGWKMTWKWMAIDLVRGGSLSDWMRANSLLWSWLCGRSKRTSREAAESTRLGFVLSSVRRRRWPLSAPRTIWPPAPSPSSANESPTSISSPAAPCTLFRRTRWDPNRLLCGTTQASRRSCWRINSRQSPCSCSRRRKSILSIRQQTGASKGLTVPLVAAVTRPFSCFKKWNTMFEWLTCALGRRNEFAVLLHVNCLTADWVAFYAPRF